MFLGIFCCYKLNFCCVQIFPPTHTCRPFLVLAGCPPRKYIYHGLVQWTQVQNLRLRETMDYRFNWNKWIRIDFRRFKLFFYYTYGNKTKNCCNLNTFEYIWSLNDWKWYKNILRLSTTMQQPEGMNWVIIYVIAANYLARYNHRPVT